MRPDQNAPQDNGLSGINMLPQYQGEVGPQEIANTYDPISLNYRPQPSAPPPRAIPVHPLPDPLPRSPMDNWRGSAQGAYYNSFPIPGTPSSTPPLEPPKSFLSNFFNTLLGVPGSIGNFGQDVIGGLGGLLQGINFSPTENSAGQQANTPMRSPSAAYGRPAFGMTLTQSHFPGSLIGPTSGLVTNPYQNTGSPSGGQQPLGGPPPAFAQAFSSMVKSRNIA